MLAPMGASSYSDIKDSLRQLYLDDPRRWLVGFSGGKDSTMLASLIVEVVAGIPEEQRKKPIAILCTDTRVEIPAIVEMVEGTLARIRRFSEQSNLNIEVNLLRPATPGSAAGPVPSWSATRPTREGLLASDRATPKR